MALVVVLRIKAMRALVANSRLLASLNFANTAVRSADTVGLHQRLLNFLFRVVYYHVELVRAVLRLDRR